MREYLAILLSFLIGISGDHEVHLVPADKICPDVSPEHNILLPDPHDCSVFYKCENGTAIPQSCPPGLEWCQILQNCTLPILANCSISHTIVTYSPEELATYNPNSTTDNPKPTGPVPHDETCPKDDVVLPYPGDCNKYYKCVHGRPQEENCPENEQFSTWIGICIAPEIANCIVKPQENKTCPVNGASHVYPTNCNQYYECVDKNVEIKECPSGEEYNEWFNICTTPELAYCHTYTTVSPTTSPSTSPTTIKTPTEGEDVCPEPGLKLPNPLNCNTYFLCVNDTPEVQQCPEGFEYSCWDQECLPPTDSECLPTDGSNCKAPGQKLPNAEDCGSYFECNNSVTVKVDCKNGLQYNAWFEKCVDPDLAHCSVKPTTTTLSTISHTGTPTPSVSDNICPQDDITLPDLFDCHSYYVCRNSTPVKEECPEGEDYSCWDQECLPSETVNCINNVNETDDCGSENNTMPNSEDCSSYFKCVNGKVVLENCEEDLEYNAWFGICVDSSQSYCPLHTTINPSTTPITTESTESTTTEQTTTLRPNPLCSKPDLMYPSPNYCNAFMKCNKDRQLLTIICNPPQFHYNCETKKCENMTHCCSRVTATMTPGPTTITETTKITETTPSEGTGSTGTGGTGSTPSKGTEGTDSTPSESTEGTGSTPSKGTEGTGSTPSKGTEGTGSTPSKGTEGTGSTPSKGTEGTGTTPSKGTEGTGSTPSKGTEGTGTTPSKGTEGTGSTPSKGTEGTGSTPSKGTEGTGTTPTEGTEGTGSTPTKGTEGTGSTPSKGTDGTGSTPSKGTEGTGSTSSKGTEGTGSTPSKGTEGTGTTPSKGTEGTGSTPSKGTEGTGSTPSKGTEGTGTTPTEGTEGTGSTPTKGTEGTGSTPSKGTDGTGSTPSKGTESTGSTPTKATEGTGTTPSKGTEGTGSTPTKGTEGTGSTPSKGTEGTGSTPSKGTEGTGSTPSKGTEGTGSTPTKGTESTGSTPSKGSEGTGTTPSKGTEGTGTTPSKGTEGTGSTPSKGTEGTGSTPSKGTEGTGTTPSKGTEGTGSTPSKGTEGTGSTPSKGTEGTGSTPSKGTEGTGTTASEGTGTATTPTKGPGCKNPSILCPKPGLLYPGTYCNAFRECDDNCKLKTVICDPPQFHYNCETKKCENISHCCSPTNSTLPPDSTTTEITDTTGTTPTTTPDSCPLDGAVLPNPLDCNSYFTCDKDKIVSEKCPDGQIYSCWDQQCEKSESATCINEGSQEGERCSKDGLKQQNVQDCGSYYQCEHGKITLKKCPKNKFYSIWFKTCKPFKSANCETYPTAKPNHTTVSPPPTTISPSPTEDVCPFEGALLPNPLNCSTYFTCVGTEPTLESCPSGQGYSCWNQRCESGAKDECNPTGEIGQTCSIEGLILPNTGNCEGYLQCQNGTIVQETCPSGTEFNAWFKKCMESKLSHCQAATSPTSPTEGTGTTPSKGTEGTGMTPSKGTEGTGSTPSKGTEGTGSTASKGTEGTGSTPSKGTEGTGSTASKGTEGTGSTPSKGTEGTGSTPSKGTESTGSTPSKGTEGTGSTPSKGTEGTGATPSKGTEGTGSTPSKGTEGTGSTISKGTEGTGSTPSKGTEGTGSTPSKGTEGTGSTPSKGTEGTGSTPTKGTEGTGSTPSKGTEGTGSTPSEGTEGTGTTASEGTGTATTPTKGPGCKNPSILCPKPGLLYPGTYCNAFRECDDNCKLKTVICDPPQFHYNCETKKCENISHCCSPTNSTLPPDSTTTEITDTTGTTPTTTPDSCPLDGAVLPNPLDCNSYFTCDKDKIVSEKCPDGQIYSCWDQQCEKSESATCINEGSQEGERCSKDGLKQQNVQDCGSYYQCEHGKITLKKCPKNKFYSIWFKTCKPFKSANCETYPTAKPNHTTVSPPPTTISPSPTEDVCPFEGALLPNPLNCSTYFTCVGTEPTLESCPSGQGYSCWNQRCESGAKDECNPTGEIGQTCSIEGLILPNTGNCEGYLQCQNGMIVQETCPSGTEFNAWFKKCMESKLSHCQAATSPTSPTEGTGTTPSKGTEGTGMTPSKATEGTGSTPSKGTESTGSTPSKGTEGTGTTPSKGTEGTGSTPSKGTEGTGSTPSKGTEGTEATPSKGTEGTGSTPSKGTEGTGSTPTKGTEGTGTTPSKGTEGTGSTPSKGTEGTGSTPSKGTEGTGTTVSEGTGTAYTPTKGPGCKNPSILCPKPGLLYPGTYCNAFKECDDNCKLKTVICDPPQFHYNCETKKCENISHCCSPTNSTLPPDSTTTEITDTTGTTATTIPDSCPLDGAILPNPLDCNSYFTCDKDKIVSEKCPDGQIYSCWDQQCEKSESATCIIEGSQEGERCSKDGLKQQNVQDCGSYYQCEHGKITLKKCPKNKFYSKWDKICKPFKSANCETYPTAKPNHTTVSPPPTTISPSPTEDVCPFEGALLPNPLNCSTYFTCVGTEPTLESCPSGQGYSCWNQRCESGAKDECNPTGEIGQTCSIEGLILPNTGNCEGYLQCQNGTIVQETCPSGTEFNAWFKKCMESKLSHCQAASSPSTTGTTPTGTNPVPSTCPIEGAKLPNPLDCNSYFTCDKKEIVSKKCPDGEIYSCWDQQCENPKDATCINEGDQEGHSCSINNELLPNIANCSSYYECIDGKVEIKVCASGHIYDQWAKICESPEVATCVTYPTVNETTPLPTDPTAPNEGYEVCPSEGALIPNPIDCKTYYKCINGTPTLENCPDGNKYSCWDQKCELDSEATCVSEGSQNGNNCSTDGLRVADVTNCNNYYECDNGTIILKHCPAGEEFNSAFKDCYKPKLAHCVPQTTVSPPDTTVTATPKPTPGPNDVCPVDGSLLPNPLNCSAYFKCVNGTPTPQLCADGYEYSCWNEECEPANEATCIAEGNQNGKSCKKNGQRNQNPEDCHSYYQCENGKVALKRCILNWFYNRWFKICVPLSILAHCSPTGPTIPPPTTPKPTPPISITDDVCPIDGALLPNPLDCSRYFKCENNKPTPQKCPSGQEYSCWDQECKAASDAQCIKYGVQLGEKCSRDGEKLPNIETCGSYYQCKNGKVEKYFCFIGFQYNQWYQKCVLIPFAHCKTAPVITTTVPTPLPPNPTPSDDYDICPIEGALLPNPVDCTAFYKCVNGTPTLDKCPDGMEYSCWDQKCELDANADCIAEGSQLGANCTVDGLRLANIEDCSTYFECCNGKAELKHCDSGKEFNDRFQNCYSPKQAHCQTHSTILPPTGTTPTSPVPGNDICPVEGAFLPNPVNCSTYFKCINGTPTLKLCADGFEYSCWDQECEPADQAQCVAVAVPVGDKCKKNGQKIQDPTDCQKYYECVKHVKVLKTCPHNLYYNKWFKTCVLEDLAYCNETTTIKPSKTPPTTVQPPSSSDTCPHNGAIIPNPTDCSSYYKCEKYKPVQKKCPKNQKYSAWDQECKKESEAQCVNVGSPLGKNCSRDGVIIQNLESCTSYFACENGIVQQRYCFLAFQYNKWYQSCQLTFFSHCRTYATIAPPKTETTTTSTTNAGNSVTTVNYPNKMCSKNGAKFPKTSNCNQYYQCNKKSLTLYNCEPGNNYDCWNQACSPVSEAKCANKPQAWEGQSCTKEGDSVPDATSCDMYYICRGKRIRHLSCPPRKQYDVLEGKCVHSATCANEIL